MMLICVSHQRSCLIFTQFVFHGLKKNGDMFAEDSLTADKSISVYLIISYFYVAPLDSEVKSYPRQKWFKIEYIGKKYCVGASSVVA